MTHHCWHSAGVSSTYGMGGGHSHFLCCNCGTRKVFSFTEEEKRLEGHGEHFKRTYHKYEDMYLKECSPKDQ